jgi:hypothetical protein
MRVPIVTDSAFPRPDPTGEEQRSAVLEVHDEVAQEVLSTDKVGLGSCLPKLKPDKDMELIDVTTTLNGEHLVWTGDSNVRN